MTASRAFRRGWAWRFGLLFLLASAAVAPFLIYYEDSRVALIAGREGVHLQTAEKTIQSAFAERQRDTVALARLPSIEHFLANEREYWAGETARAFQDYCTTYGHYDQIRLIRLDGQELIRVNRNGGACDVMPVADLQNKANRYYFRDTTLLDRGEVFVSPLDLNVENGTVEIPHKPVVRFSTPVTDSGGRNKAILVLNYLAQDVLTNAFPEPILSGQDPSREVDLLLNNNGYYLKNDQDPDRLFGFMFDRPQDRFGADHPDAIARFLAGESDIGTIEGMSGVRTADALFLAKSIAVPISPQVNGTATSGPAQPGTDWYAIRRIDDSVLRAGSIVSGPYTWLYAALYLLALGGASFQWARFDSLREERKRQSREKALILSTVGEGIFGVDSQGRTTFLNPMAESLLGWRFEDLQGKCHHDFIHGKRADGSPFPQEDCPVFKTLTQGVVQRVAHDHFWTKDGKMVPVSFVSSPQYKDGKVIGAVTVFQDISDRLKSENALVEARDKARAGEQAKAEFLTVMSHEMRTPLNGLLGTMNLLRDTDPTPQQAELLDHMDVSGRLLLDHVNDVLDISKYEAGKLEIACRVFDLDTLLTEVCHGLQGLAADQGNKLHRHWGGAPLARMKGDPLRLRQVLINLVGNALKFTRHGEVTIRAESLSVQGTRHMVEFRVTDTGIGMDEADLKRIFEDFKTLDTNYGRQVSGTGMGLGISRRLVQAMGGEIGVESVMGAGSLFWVRLPLDEAPAAPAAKAIEAAPARAATPLDILVVEDNQINRFILRKMLEREGHGVTEAEDGAEGVRKAGMKRFDMILMDISMPVMDGTTATRAIRDGTGPSRDVPILAVTAHAIPAELEAFKDAGMTGHVIKPFTREDLAATLGHHTGVVTA